MLRKISAYLSLVSLITVSLVPAATTFASPRGNNNQQHKEKKTAPEFASTSNSTAIVRLIMQTKGAPTTALDGALARAHSNKRATYTSLNTIVVDVPLNEVAGLAAREDVVYVAPDRPVKAQMNLTSDTTGASLAQAGQAGTPGVDGKGVGIAILDSGISANHPDFVKNNNSRVIASVDFIGSKRSGDADGHGTGVAGLAAGNGAASNGYSANYAGIAPGANLIDVRVLDEHGLGRTSNVLGALDWVIQNRQRYNIRVVNLSLSTPVRESFHTDPLCQAVEQAVRAGIVVVSSAGNLGRTDVILGYNKDGSPIYQMAYGAVGSPGNSPYVITVGATDSHNTVRRSDDTVASFSSKGPTQFDHLAKPDIVAPGRRVVAPLSQEPNPTLAIEYPERVVQPASGSAARNVYFNYSGTSFSAPVVAGPLALMLVGNKILTPTLL